MASSPYLDPVLKEYVKLHEIETILNSAVNDLLRNKPADPFAYLSKYLGKSSQNVISLEKVEAIESLSNEGTPVLKLDLAFNYKMMSFSGVTHQYNLPSDPTTISGVLFDHENQARFNGKGFTHACKLANEFVGINRHLKAILGEVDCNNVRKIDDALSTFYNKKEKGILNVTNAASAGNVKGLAKISGIPLYKQIAQSYLPDFKTELHPKEIFVPVLNGSKPVNSKCKITKFYLIFNPDKAGIDKVLLINTLILAVRAKITSDKKGEANLKIIYDGSFVCPFDDIKGNMKLLEDTIKAQNLQDLVKIGLYMNADDLYHDDVAKYEIENPQPKSWLDENQVVDFYVKLITDYPSISYLEDPVRTNSADGWVKLFEKFKDKKVHFGSRKMYSNIALAKEWTMIPPPPEKKPGAEGQVEEIKKEEEPPKVEEKKEDPKKASKKDSKDSKKEVKKDTKADPKAKPGDAKKDEVKEPESHEKKLVHLNYAVLNPNDFPTLSALIDLCTYLASKKPETKVIFTDNYYEDADSFVVDLAYTPLKASLMLAPPFKYERMSKYNRIIEIENEILAENSPKMTE